ncbi:MAG: Nitrilotriacetate monooxygenase component B [uncultured Thermomicrobiales bacterium]|uniref:Nitrilotriacetate monooxygenase component B n=1 Tax=uncultured Thermomicrobiales bacterium TaxID=1645740 RepID=A0A6J4U3L2_9BACT|nr:MAG: Nitrilotriacetate monooxygenase component B [uncultured Thermomicrobiales bacterium]
MTAAEGTVTGAVLDHGVRDISPDDLAWREKFGGVLKAVVVPRPIAWVSTVAPDGTLNLAPHSYFMVLSDRPPILGFVSSGRKDTLRNIESSGEYVINVAGDDLIEPLNLSAANFPRDQSEFAWADLAPRPSVTVAVPGVAAAPVALEMRLLDIREYGDQPSYLIAGTVTHARIAERVWRDDKVAPDLLRAFGRLGGNLYARTTDRFERVRPTYEGLKVDGAE